MGTYVPMVCPKCGAPLDSNEETIECEYCGTRLFLHHSEPQSAKSEAQARTATGTTPLKPFVGQDSTTGLPAFHLLVPERWRIEGGVTWVPGRPGAPVQIALNVTHPTNLAAFEIFPTQYFVWMTNAPMGPAPGTFYFGSEVQMPLRPEEAVTQVILPRFRQQSVEILNSEPDSAWAQRIIDVVAPPPNAQLQREGITMRTRYTVQQTPVEEEIRAVVEYVRMAVPAGWMMIDTTYWNITRAVGYRAPTDQVDTYRPIFRKMADSMDPNPQWMAAVQQISQVMVQNQIQHINQLGNTARRIAQQYDQMGDEQYQSWQRRQDAMDRSAESFSEYIRSVDTYLDPVNDITVELPTGYEQAWTNPLGEYLVSDDPLFNPNEESNGSWTRIFQRRDSD